ncbi:MAG: GumC family protein, partial [Gammaproteobacteria bacterium]
MIPDHYNRIPLNEQLAGIWQRRKWLFIVAFFLVFPAGVALVLSLPPLYRAQTTLLVGQGDIANGVINNGATESVAARLDVIRKEITSRASLQDLIERFDLYPQYRGQPVGFVVNRLRKDIGIRQEAVATQAWNEEPTITLILSYQSQDPALAAEVANELATMYGRENEELLQTRSARTAEFLRGQLDEVNARLAKQEKLIRDFRNENLRKLPEQQSFSLQMLEQLNTELRINSEAQLTLMNRRDAILTGSGMGFLSNSSLAEAASATGLSELELRRIELNQMLGRYTDRHPQVQRLQREIERLEAEPAPVTRGRGENADDSAAPARSR